MATEVACPECGMLRAILDTALQGNVLQEEQLQRWYVASKFALRGMPATIARNRLAEMVKRWEDAQAAAGENA